MSFVCKESEVFNIHEDDTPIDEKDIKDVDKNLKFVCIHEDEHALCECIEAECAREECDLYGDCNFCRSTMCTNNCDSEK